MQPKTRGRKWQEAILNYGWRIPVILPGHKPVKQQGKPLIVVLALAAAAALVVALYAARTHQRELINAALPWAVGGLILVFVLAFRNWRGSVRDYGTGWLPVEATLVDHEIRRLESGDPGRWGWRLLCRFEYEGRAYEVTPEEIGRIVLVRNPAPFKSEEEARRNVAVFTENENRVPLRVNPTEPLECMLDRKDLEAPVWVKESRPRRSGLQLIGPALFAAAGLAVSAFGLTILLEALDSRDWPSVTGTVMESKISQRGRKGRRTEHRVVLSYTYDVDGQTFTGDRIRLTRFRNTDFSAASATRDLYRSGRVVPVYYKPGSPGESVLEPGFNWSSAFPLGLGLTVCAVAGLFARRYFRKKEPTVADRFESPAVS